MMLHNEIHAQISEKLGAISVFLIFFSHYYFAVETSERDLKKLD